MLRINPAAKASGPRSIRVQSMLITMMFVNRRAEAYRRPNAVIPDPTQKFQVMLRDDYNWCLSAIRKWRIFKLVKLLNFAEQELRKGEWDATWAAVESADDLANKLQAYQEQFRRDDLSMLSTARAVFLPTGPWDELRCVSGCRKPAGIDEKIEVCMAKLR